MKRLIIAIIKFYQRLPLPTHSVCHFTPTCSEYTLQAVQKYGSIRGLCLGFMRIIRCNPFSRGGFDPCPNNS
ncbi:MAG: membrane protein insertion efficiency factor YidD [bacterium]